MIDGFSNGFSLHFAGPCQSYVLQNSKSVLVHEKYVLDKILKEKQLGRVEGLFTNKHLTHFHVGPLGVFPKKEPGGFRIIYDFSQPPVNLVGDIYATVQYETFVMIKHLATRFNGWSKCFLLSFN